MNSNWSYSPETKIWVVTSVTLIFDLWPWPFAWTLPWSNVITPENFMMIRWWEHSQKGVTDGQTDRRTENTIHRAAWSQLKMVNIRNPSKCPYFLSTVRFITQWLQQTIQWARSEDWRFHDIPSWHGNSVHITGPLWEETTVLHGKLRGY